MKAGNKIKNIDKIVELNKEIEKINDQISRLAELQVKDSRRMQKRSDEISALEYEAFKLRQVSSAILKNEDLKDILKKLFKEEYEGVNERN